MAPAQLTTRSQKKLNVREYALNTVLIHVTEEISYHRNWRRTARTFALYLDMRKIFRFIV